MRKSFYVLGLLFFCFFLSSVSVKAIGVTPGAPVISSNPHDTAVCTGSVAWFAIAANDTAGGDTMSIHYTWKVSPDGGTTWDTVHNTAIYSGAAKDTLKIHTTYSMNSYLYMCGATNDSGTIWSSAAVLQVDTANSGTITGNIPGCVGSTITLASTVSGGAWSNSNHAIDTVDNSGNVYGIHFGNDTVKYTVINTCGTSISRTLVHIDTNAINAPIYGPTATCVGHSIDMTNTNVLGTGVWSVTNSSASVTPSGGVVTGVSGGLDTVMYTFTNGCGTIDTSTTVQVDTIITPGTISGPSAVCAGSWITLTSSLSGGDWLSGNSAVAVTDMSGNVTGVSQGTSTISYYFSNACGVSSATHTVTVAIPAGMISGLDSVGVGATRTFMDATPGGVWSIPIGTAATVGSATGIVTGVTTGDVDLIYTVANACGTTTGNVVVYVGVPPSAGVIHGKDSVCIGHTITLSDTTRGGIWTNADDTVASVNDTGLVTGLVYGADHITYTVTNGFGSGTTVYSVFVNHKPTDSISVPALFAEGGNYNFNGYTLVDTNWVYTPGTWTSSNDSVGNFLGTPGFFVLCCYSGSTTITYSAVNPCGTTDTSFVITVPHFSGVNELKNNNAVLNVYPNPSGGDFTINLMSGVSEDVTVTITDIVGQKVKEFTMHTKQPFALKLDQADGIYFLSASSSTGKYSAKITITK